MTASNLLPAIATILAVGAGTVEIDLGRDAGVKVEEQGPETSETSDASEPALEQALVAHTNGSCLNVRPTPEAVMPALTCVPEGTRLTIIESVPGWKKAQLDDGRQGWVTAAFLSGLPGDRTAPKPEAELSDRSGASESELRSEPPVSEARESSTTPRAVRVSEARIENFSASDADAGNSLVVLESAKPCLNFRADPSSAGKVFECLEPGTVLGSVGRLDGWRYVELIDNRAGWVSAQHVGPVNVGGGG